MALELRRRVRVEIHIWGLLANTGYLKPLLLALDFFFFLLNVRLTLYWFIWLLF